MLEVVLPQGSRCQVSEPVGECFAPALFITKEAAMQTVKTAGGQWALKEVHSWVSDSFKWKDMWPGRRICSVEKEQPCRCNLLQGVDIFYFLLMVCWRDCVNTGVKNFTEIQRATFAQLPVLVAKRRQFMFKELTPMPNKNRIFFKEVFKLLKGQFNSK